MRIAVAVLFLLVAASADAQIWAELNMVPRATSVRVYELGGKGWVSCARTDCRLTTVALRLSP